MRTRLIRRARRAGLLIAAAVVLLGLCPARAGAPGAYEAESLSGGELVTDGVGGDYYVYSPNGGTVGDFLVGVFGTDTVTIGSSGGATELGVPTRFDASLMLVEAGATGRLVAPAGAAGGSVFVTDELELSDTGTFVVEAGVDGSPAGRNRVIIELLDGRTTTFGAGNRLIVRDRAEAEIRHRNYENYAITFELAGGTMSFAESLTMRAGTITATAGESTLAVGNGLVLNLNDLNYTDMPTLRVCSGAGLTLLRESGGTEAADITLGNGARLDIQSGGVLNAGTVRFTQDHDLTLALTPTPAQGGTVNAKRLEFTTLTDAAGLTWHVSEAAAFSGSYTVKGTGNTYGALEMSAGSVLTSDAAADTAITLGTESAPGGVRLDGASIRAGAGREFAINGARIVLASAPVSGAALDAGAGRLDLSKSAVRVDADVNATPGGVMIFDAAAGIAVGEYEHASGTVAVNGGAAGSGGFAVSGAAVVGGNERAAKFTVNGTEADFGRGLALRSGAVLAAGTGGGTVTLGGDLTLSGGAELDGGTGGLVLAGTGNSGDAAAPAPAVRVTGGGNSLRGMVSTGLALRMNTPGAALALDGAVLTAGSVTIERGGMYAVGAPSTIRSGGTGGGVFAVAKDGAIETTSAGLTVEGYDSVVLDGTLTAGWDGTGAAALTTDSDVVLGPTAAIHFTDELLANVTPGPEAVVIKLTDPGKTITAEGDLSSKSIFGSIGMTAAGGTLAVTSMENRIKADSSPEDIALAAGNMRAVWGDGQIPTELAALTYAVAVAGDGNGGSGTPAPGDAPGRNRALLRGIANPSGVAAGLDTVEYLNGSAAAKVNAAGLMAAAAVAEQVSGRARALRGQLSASGSAASDGAFASAVTDVGAGPVGGVYFTGLRVWEEQDGGEGFTGYEYDAHGFLLGYDRALSGNIALGASFAYYQGGYADAGALASASGLDGYALAAYGVYNHEDGLFLSASAGYARLDNDIQELRNDPSAPAGASWASAGYDSGVLTLAVDAGFDYNPADYLTLTPSVGLLYLRSAAADHDSSLAGTATQRERGVSSDALLFPLRLAGKYEANLGAEGRLVLTAHLGYTFNAIRSSHSGRVGYYGLSPSVPVTARALPRHSVTAGLGVRLVYRCFDFGLDYSFAGGDGRAAHRLAGTVGSAF